MAEVLLQVAGDALHGVHHAPQGSARGAVLMLHGFNSDRRELGDWPERIAAAGYHAFAFDQRGFGGSGGTPGRTGLAGVRQDIDACVAFLRERCGDVPLGILGHSLGGHYAVAACRNPSPFACLIAAHPVDALWDELNPVERAAYALLGTVAQRRLRAGKSAGAVPFRVDYKQLFEAPEAVAAARAMGFLRRRVDLGNYPAARHQRASQWASDVVVPALVIQSPNDRVVKPAHSRAIHDALAGPKTWLEHTGGHSCALDRDGARIAAAVIGFLDQHLGGKA